MKNKTKEILTAMLGGCIFAVAVAWIASPSGLVTGGVSGIGIIAKELTHGTIPVFLTGIVLNIPLFIICTVQRGFGFIVRSALAFTTLTIALSVAESIPPPVDLENDLLLTALLYGALSGIGLGLVLRSGATSGGTDMLAAIIKRSAPTLSVPMLIAVIDIVIVAAGAFVFGLRISMYAAASLVLSAKIMDIVISGPRSSKAVFVVSEKSRAISERIFSELSRGVTGIDVTGMYTERKKVMLFTVISARELPQLRRIVCECDSGAFVTVSDAARVLGQGFDDLMAKKDSLS